jgi:hypothetical protein
MKFIRDILTGIDGQTYDNIRVGIAAALATTIGAVVTQLWKGQPVDLLAFGGATAAILGAGGFGISQKAKTEPGRAPCPPPQ